MSKKNIIIITISGVLIIIVVLIFIFFTSNKITPVTTTTNPFGNSSGNNNNTIVSSSTNINNQISKASGLTQIYRNPTSGSVIFANKNNLNVIRFIDRANGNVYEYLPNTQTGEPQRITNTTIPKIQEAVWLNTGQGLIFRYLNNDTDSITNFLSKIITSSSTSDNVLGEITGSFIGPGSNQLITNPSGNKIFELFTKSNNTGTFGLTLSSDGTGSKQIFDSPILYWNISWPKENLITFTTKPSYKYPGYLFFFNPQTGTMDRVLGDLFGLSTLTNNDASMVAYSVSKDDSFTLDVYDVKNKTSKNLDVNTLVDKCVWGVKNSSILYCAIPNIITSSYYPDAWYQGIVSSSDNLWSIDTKTGETDLLYQIGIKENAQIDTFDLQISPDDKYISFSNKNDLSLWLLDISNL